MPFNKLLAQVPLFLTAGNSRGQTDLHSPVTNPGSPAELRNGGAAHRRNPALIPMRALGSEK